MDVDAWQSGEGMPPNMMHKSSLRSGNVLWYALMWCLQREAHRRAHRPLLWRRGRIKLRYKKGAIDEVEAWRLTTVADLNGLVYERIWWTCVVHQYSEFVKPILDQDTPDDGVIS